MGGVKEGGGAKGTGLGRQGRQAAGRRSAGAEEQPRDNEGTLLEAVYKASTERSDKHMRGEARREEKRGGLALLHLEGSQL